MESFRLLNDIKHKEARKVVYGDITNLSYEILGLNYNERNVEKLKIISTTMARTDLNEIATLIRHNIVERTIFLEEYWWIILRVWHEVETKINERRQSNAGPPDYMKNFEELKIKAEKYAKKHQSEGLRRFQKWKEQNKQS